MDFGFFAPLAGPELRRLPGWRCWPHQSRRRAYFGGYAHPDSPCRSFAAAVTGTVEDDFSDVVHDTPQCPDDGDFLTPSIVDSVQSFCVAEVGEDRFDGAHPVAVALSRLRGVDFGAHGMAIGACGLDATAQAATFAVLAQALFTELADLTEVGVGGVSVEFAFAFAAG